VLKQAGLMGIPDEATPDGENDNSSEVAVQKVP
jgi:hypothetical protein